MSTTDGDASSRLASALDDVFKSAPTLPPRDGEVAEPAETAPPEVGESANESANESPSAAPPPEPEVDWNVDGPDDAANEPFTLPEIVPATTHPVDPPPVAAAPVAPAPSPPVATPPVALAPTAPAARVTPSPSPTAPASRTTPATGWGDHMASVMPASAQGAQLRAPGRRPRVRRVTRVLRHIDPWSTFKVALLFSVVGYIVALTSGVLLWRVADSTGTLANVERWFTQFGWETFELKGGEIFHNAWILGLFGAVALTGGLVLLATLFNLVSDIIGGVRLTVLEEEVVERTVSSTRRYVVRRPPAGAADIAGEQAWDVDDDSPVDDATPTTDAADWDVVVDEPADAAAAPADGTVDATVERDGAG